MVPGQTEKSLCSTSTIQALPEQTYHPPSYPETGLGVDSALSTQCNYSAYPSDICIKILSKTTDKKYFDSVLKFY
ncbi:hypothetical protein GCM10022398_05140 [Acetobacter lovaniensis]|jgi:hypothetical protein|nr:hypothetical protein AA0474_2974 [Acetobacter lovaniensis NRIC 0474]